MHVFVTTGQGRKEVESFAVEGHWAITRGVSCDEHIFRLTHIPTGYALPMKFESKSAARRCHRFLLDKSREFGFDWSSDCKEDFSKKNSPSAYRFLDEVRNKDWGLVVSKECGCGAPEPHLIGGSHCRRQT